MCTSANKNKNSKRNHFSIFVPNNLQGGEYLWENKSTGSTFSFWTEKGDDTDSWGKAAFGVSSLNKIGSSVWVTMATTKSGCIISHSNSIEGALCLIWVKAFSCCQALFESTSTATSWGASCKDTRRAQRTTDSGIISQLTALTFSGILPTIIRESVGEPHQSGMKCLIFKHGRSQLKN